MVRVNLVEPKRLSDQHLIAEYNEILMLLAYVKRYPALREIPKEYCLGKGHMKFFKDKLKFLQKRHESLKKEMRRRNFRANKTIRLSDFPKNLRNDWEPSEGDYKKVKKRLREKIMSKSNFYRYEGVKKGRDFFLDMLGIIKSQ
ncbi:MAG: pyrimidine dimer DNA glycosylase/endonuclease V [Candidatus Nanoarchaeia archaeon]